MADVVEYLYRGAAAMQDDRIDWVFQDDSVTPGTYADTTLTPTRIVLTLTETTTGSVITLNTSGGTYTLTTDGSAGNFMWTAASSTLTIDLGGTTLLAAGTYSAQITWYDATNTNALRWSRQRIFVIIG